MTFGDSELAGFETGPRPQPGEQEMVFAFDHQLTIRSCHAHGVWRRTS